MILQMYTINNIHIMYGSRNMESNGQKFLSFWTIFSLSPPNNLKNQNSKNMKKVPWDIIILQMCTKNHDQMLQCSRDMACDAGLQIAASDQ